MEVWGDRGAQDNSRLIFKDLQVEIDFSMIELQVGVDIDLSVG
jgi:hypothetical protein